jgi:PAS domain S-box-containing protein/putative nucleotidyltransferase with HDIG domain
MVEKRSEKHFSLHLHFFTTKAFLVMCICIFVTLSIFIPYNQKLQNTTQLISDTEKASLSIVRATELRFKSLYDSMNRLTFTDYTSNRTSWFSDAKFLRSSFNEIEYIAWVDQDFVIRDIVPIEGNESYLNKNASLVQEGPSSINQWFSVLDGTIFQGFVLCSIQLKTLIEPFESTVLKGFMIQILKDEEVIYSSPDWNEPNEEFTAIRPFTLQNFSDITIICAPSNASIQALQRSLYGTIALIHILSLLACLTIFFAQKFYSSSKMNESRYQNLLDEATLLAIIINTEGKVTYCNDFFLSSTGWKRDEVLGTNFFQRFSANNNQKESKLILDSIAKGILPIHSEFPLITKNGDARWIRFNSTLQRNERGAIIGFSALGEDITEQKKNSEALLKQYTFLKTLFSIDQSITAREPISKILNYILDQVNLQLGSNASSVLLFNKETHNLEYVAGRGFRTMEIERTKIPLGGGLTGLSALEQTSRSTCDIQDQKTGFIRKNMAKTEGFNCYHVEPLLVKNKINGVLEVFFKKNDKPDDNWDSLIKAIAQQTAIAIDNSTLFTDLERSNHDLLSSYESTIEGWSRALDLKDSETENHSIRVTEMTMRLCKARGMSETELADVRRGALLHDIGKMGIPDSILLKKEKLTESDWDTIKKHPQFAYELLYPIEYLRTALDIPYCHHEKWDGSGYPRGLKGEKIPLAARLFAVVDVWDALLSDRPYRPGWQKERVFEEIRRLSGSHFDPESVNIFFKVLEEVEHNS